MTDQKVRSDLDRRGNSTNRDPISGTPGAHPVGTGAGAASGAAAGATAGAVVGGPIGLAVGGVAGAVIGGLAGKGVAEAMNPTAEDAYWRENYSNRPYAESDTKYETLEPAYRFGWESRSKNSNREWDEVEGDLRDGWSKARGESTMSWNDAMPATRDAWDRVGHANERMDDDGGEMKDVAQDRD